MKDIELTPEDRERLDIIRSCIVGDITNATAAGRLHLKVRQVQRLKHAVRETGDGAIVHGNRGKTPHNATRKTEANKIVSFLKKKKHRDFGPTFAMEKLAEKKDIHRSRESVRRLMVKNGLWEVSPRQGPVIHRQWRERRALYGELVQFDGSYHRWFEDGEEHCVLAAIDDATSIVPQALFENNEGIQSVFRFWLSYIETHGLPVAIYLDKFSTYKINHQRAVDNEELMTQFQRAMGELGIKVICANSPEAKGRIERLFKTMQDRLVKEMRLEGIKETKAADDFLKETYLPDHNKRFSVEARQQGDAHRPLTDALKQKLPAIFSIQSKRQIRNDFTFQFKNQWYQLTKEQPVALYPKDTILIEERLDGSIHVRFKDTYLAFRAISKIEKTIRPKVTIAPKSTAHTPAANHPWRRAATLAAAIAAAKKLRNGR